MSAGGPTRRRRRVRVVMVNHQGGAMTLDALDRLHAAAAAERDIDLDVVVVDNASTDGVVDAIAADRPWARTVVRADNGGFARACNDGIGDLDAVGDPDAAGDLDAIVLLNNDAWPEPGWLGPLLAALDADHQLGAVCPKVLRPPDPSRPGRSGAPDVIDRVGGVLYEGGFGGDIGAGELDEGQYDQTAEVFAWTGCAVALRPAYLQAVGLFDPRYFLYYEDLELSWRGRRMGWRYAAEPSSVVRHRGGATIGHGSDLHTAQTVRNRLVTLAIHAPWSLAGRQLLAELHTALRRQRRLRLRSIAGAVAALPHALRRRRWTDGRATVDRRALLAWARPRPGPASAAPGQPPTASR